MRPDQLKQLDDIAERLADAFIIEADPNNWPAAGELPMDMSRDDRGDRHWCKKGAMGTGGVLKYVLDIKARAQGSQIDDDEEQEERDNELEGQIRRAKSKAAEILKKIKDKDAGKATYDRRVHGRG